MSHHSNRARFAVTLRRVLKAQDLWEQAEVIFTAWPNLEEVTNRYCAYVTPYIEIEGIALLGATLERAVEAYFEAAGRGAREQMGSYIRGLAEAATLLGKVRCSVCSRGGEWLVWGYDRPLVDFMHSHGTEVLQIAMRDEVLPAGPIAVKMLAHICTLADMQVAELRVAQGGRECGAMA
jgi:hypothetical protein